MFKLLLGFLTVFSFICFSQTNLTDLQKQLPKTVRENPGLLKQITQTLQRDITLNPDLVAYRIDYYKKLFDEGIKDNDLNGMNNLRLLTIEYYQQRNNWIDREKEIINNSTYSLSYKIRSLEFLNDFYSEIIDTIIKVDYNLDANYVDYFVAMSLGTRNLGDFSPSNDYTKSKDAIEKVIRDTQIEKLKYIGLKNQEVEPIKNIMDYWYLFPNEGNNIDFLISNLLLKYFESEYSLNGFPSSEIFFGVNFFQIKEKIDIKSNGSIIPNDQVLGEVKNSTQFNLSYNYKLILMDNLGPFSFITFGIGSGVSLDAKTDVKNNLIVYQRDPLPNNGFVSQTWNIDELISKDPFRASLYFKGTTPVLFFNRNIFIQVGLISGVNFSSYKLQYSYSYDKVQVVWDENLQRFVSTLLERKIGDQASEENNQTKFFIYPNIDLSIYSFNPILLQFSAGYNFISAKIGFGF